MKRRMTTLWLIIMAFALCCNCFALDAQSAAAAQTGQPPAGPAFSARFIDVGQADAALIECDGRYMLIDGGNKSDSSRIYTILKNSGISKLDIVVGSHPHEDHIGGLPGAFSYAGAALTLCPVTQYDSEAFDDFARYAALKGGGITVPKAGDQYALGSAQVTVLGVNAGSGPNDSSIILKVQYGGTSFLFTGDAEREAEQAVINSGADLSATVLKAAHHGSDTSTSYLFLREVMPRYAVIPVGGNSYGHPTDAVLSRLRDAGASVYRTDLHGDITFTSDGETLTVSTAKAAAAQDVMKAGSGGAAAPAPPAYAAPPAAPEAAGPGAGPSGPDALAAPESGATSPEPVGTDYIINANTGKFHYPQCRSVKQMKEANKRFFTGGRGELVAQGYSPCGNCDP